MAVEVLAGPVVPHRGARIGVAGGDLGVPQVHTRIQHGRDEGMAEHVRVWLGDPHASTFGQVPQSAGGHVASILVPRLLSRIGPRVRVPMARPTAGGSGISTTLVPLPHTRSTWWPMFLAEIGGVGAGGFEDPQTQQAEHSYQREIVWVG